MIHQFKKQVGELENPADFFYSTQPYRHGKPKKYLFRWPPIYMDDCFVDLGGMVEQFRKFQNGPSKIITNGLFKTEYG